MLRGKRNRKGECAYGCCRAWDTKRGSYRTREKRAWKKEEQ